MGQWARHSQFFRPADVSAIHSLPEPPQQNGGMNPVDRDAARSAGLQLFQELSTLGQQLTHPPLLGSSLGRIKPMFPPRPPRPREPFRGARSGTRPPVHAASSFGHRRAYFGFVKFSSGDPAIEIK